MLILMIFRINSHFQLKSAAICGAIHRNEHKEANFSMRELKSPMFLVPQPMEAQRVGENLVQKEVQS